MATDAWRLEGKRALVTGASGGLGAHFAAILGYAGASVLIAARREEALEMLANDLRTDGVKVQTLPLDVTDCARVIEAIGAVDPIDILVNNAGIVRSNPALSQTEEDWDAVIDTNLKGMFITAQAAANRMKTSGKGGSIINVASILGLRQAGGVLPYAVSKAGVIQMTKSLALEVARHGIRVNALAPGYLATDLNREFFESPPGQAMIGRIPMRRLGNLEDLDGPLLLLASEASRYMNGSTIVVDGGHLVSTL
ncbi:SDR family NAD(P)-dependent oxidoreductase [Sphingobium baderi]|uniref:SDR family NAD(P)-dependent oxidoreductase n=1 Tax=Sphingobium baderi TaxID=1332080 RepID=UPI002B415893|nr:SDR family NAD(P)-dependent oxidoreductase [Sphingobium baderi]WRD75320.1 SDR family NAD(P)-dependent oxidoreductase [Sphingobium baderi]